MILWNYDEETMEVTRDFNPAVTRNIFRIRHGRSQVVSHKTLRGYVIRHLYIPSSVWETFRLSEHYREIFPCILPGGLHITGDYNLHHKPVIRFYELPYKLEISRLMLNYESN